ncbi:MAG TPA: DUF6789 family protein [Polyangia bacterium]|nr:DUF6789 family protein [Polyangia bacterium]
MSPNGRRLVYGALGGVVGAACMTAVRMAARRRGMIDKTVSQTAEEWLTAHVDVPVPREPALHHALDQALHFGYGAALGLAYALVAPRRPDGGGRGLAFGVATWFLGSWAMMPALGAKRPPWRKSLAENAVDVAAHGLYGVVTALVAGEMQRQPDHGPTSDAHRYFTRSG